MNVNHSLHSFYLTTRSNAIAYYNVMRQTIIKLKVLHACHSLTTS